MLVRVMISNPAVKMVTDGKSPSGRHRVHPGFGLAVYGFILLQMLLCVHGEF